MVGSFQVVVHYTHGLLRDLEVVLLRRNKEVDGQNRVSLLVELRSELDAEGVWLRPSNELSSSDWRESEPSVELIEGSIALSVELSVVIVLDSTDSLDVGSEIPT